MSRCLIRILAGILLFALLAPVRADTVTVAVAANFSGPAGQLARAFAAHTGHQIVLSSGATGQLFARIANGAPYDVFLSADDQRPRQLIEQGLAVAGSEFIYATGRLALWSPDPLRVQDASLLLKDPRPKKIALANPRAAPYGAAAIATLQKLERYDALKDRLVYGESITQAFQFAASGNAQAAFVALAQIKALPTGEQGSWWTVPAELHAPLHQQAVLLKRAEGKAAARAWLDYLRSAEARTLIQHLGYEAPLTP